MSPRGYHLAEANAIPVIVLSRQQDPVELINSTLRNAGHAVHCHWVRDLQSLGEALVNTPPRLMFLCVPQQEDVVAALEIRDRFASAIPAILVRDALTESELAAAAEAGAQDVVTLEAAARLQAVAARELNLARLEQSLAGTLASARHYREAMRAFMTGSADAIAQVQEGIVVDVNPAWVELFGQQDGGALLGQPLMDHFQTRSHAALKGALVAAAQGKWAGHSLGAVALLPDGQELPLEIELQRLDYEGEPAVRLRILTQQRDLESLSGQLEEALRFDDVTGLLKRPVWREMALARIGQPLKGGLRSILYIEADQPERLAAEFGPYAMPDVLDALGGLVRDQLQTGDLASRMTSHGIAVLLERGTERDVEAWLGHLLQRIAGHDFVAGNHTARLTASAGTATCDPKDTDLDRLLQAALEAARKAGSAGGNRVLSRKAGEPPPQLEDADRAWAARIKSALMANRLRLVQQPIASLVGEDRVMVDLLVRMLDEQGQEILPSEFIAAAERTDLVKNIDRWVLGAARSDCAAKRPDQVFVKLSRDSVLDRSLGAWLEQQVRASGIEAERIVIELDETVAANQLEGALALRQALQALGLRLAIENYGSSGEAARVLARLEPEYVKIDGALMQGLAGDHASQDQVKSLVEEARERGSATIAERVEDANTMAVLWQLGIEFVQGYFVNQPEDVVLAADQR
jgi:multidomain signaling protein FimX